MRQRIILVILTLVLIITVLLIYSKPSEIPNPKPLSEDIYTLHFPLLYGSNNPTSDKMGLAWAYQERGWPKGLLPYKKLPYYHNWMHDGGIDAYGYKIGMVWSDEKNGYPYFDVWLTWIRNWENRNGKLYSDFVLWGNEPDRPDQAAMSIEETAQLFLDLASACPNCKLIGPGYSSADDGQKVRQVWDMVRNLCGLPCPELNRFYAVQPHLFPVPNFELPSIRIDIYCDWVFGSVYYDTQGNIFKVADGIITPCQKPVWPTVGYRTCYPNTKLNFAKWVENLELDSRVKTYFVFTTYQEPEPTCYFSAMLNYNTYPTYTLTPLGQGVNEGFTQSVQENPYP